MRRDINAEPWVALEEIAEYLKDRTNNIHRWTGPSIL
jgi:hypothetical protein